MKYNPCNVTCSLVVAIAAALLFAGLDNSILWEDEAFVAITAKAFLQHGHFSCWDGRNLYVTLNGHGFDSSLNSRYLLDSLLCAVSFKLFGISTYSARLLFAVVGVLVLVAFWVYLRYAFPRRYDLHAYAMACLGLSTPFLMYSRTCRYYGLAMLAAILLATALNRAVETLRIRYFVLAGVAVVFFFYSNFLLAAAAIAGLMLASLLCEHANRALMVRRLAMYALPVFVLGVAPYLAIIRPWEVHVYDKQDGFWYHWAMLLYYNFRDANGTGMPWLVAVAGVALAVANRTKLMSSQIGRASLQHAVCVVGFIVALSVLSPQRPSSSNCADVRYLSVLLPLFAILTSLVLTGIHRRAAIAGVVCVTLIACTNLFSLRRFPVDFTQMAPSSIAHPMPRNWDKIDATMVWLLPAYMWEASHPYPTGMSEVIDTLAKVVQQDDLVYDIPMHDTPELQFYLGDRIKICCQVTKTTPIPLDVLRRLPAPLLKEDYFPDWILLSAIGPVQIGEVRYFSRRQVVDGKVVAHKYAVVGQTKSWWYSSQRPEFMWHTFGPTSSFDPNTDAVYVLHRVQ